MQYNINMNKFAERLKLVLKDLCMTQKDFANKIGMSQTIVSNYCKGKREPTLDILILICKALGESADFLLCLKDE